jgi:hypothetical protein
LCSVLGRYICITAINIWQAFLKYVKGLWWQSNLPIQTMYQFKKLSRLSTYNMLPILQTNVPKVSTAQQTLCLSQTKLKYYYCSRMNINCILLHINILDSQIQREIVHRRKLWFKWFRNTFVRTGALILGMDWILFLNFKSH